MVARAGYFGAHNLLSELPREYSSRLLARAPAILLEKGQTLFEIGAKAMAAIGYSRTGIDRRRTRNA